jgi:DNA-binding CsgD family transcriptional regulator
MSGTDSPGASSPSAGDATDSDDQLDMFLHRFRGLTAREVRVAILVVNDGLGYHALSTALGVSRGSVANTMQAVRRKLAVPRNEDLAAFFARTPSLREALPPAMPAEGGTATPGVEHRRKDVLRVTIAELESVAVRARRRADALETFGTSVDEVDRHEESTMARRVAERVEQLVVEVLAEVRGTSDGQAPPGRITA